MDHREIKSLFPGVLFHKESAPVLTLNQTLYMSNGKMYGAKKFWGNVILREL
jgi:hypothetical protein